MDSKICILKCGETGLKMKTMKEKMKGFKWDVLFFKPQTELCKFVSPEFFFAVFSLFALLRRCG